MTMTPTQDKTRHLPFALALHRVPQYLNSGYLARAGSASPSHQEARWDELASGVVRDYWVIICNIYIHLLDILIWYLLHFIDFYCIDPASPRWPHALSWAKSSVAQNGHHFEHGWWNEFWSFWKTCGAHSRALKFVQGTGLPLGNTI